jgi:hypothetical protein
LPWKDKLLALNGKRSALVNHLAVVSAVQPAYSKSGRQLVSVNSIGMAPRSEPELGAWKRRVQEELSDLVGPEARGWTYLRHYVVERALPKRFGRPPAFGAAGVFFAGDYVENPSIQGAMLAGERAAESALRAVRS